MIDSSALWTYNPEHMEVKAVKQISKRALKLRILSFVVFTFITYFSIGVTLAVLPTFVHARLGVDAFIAGLLISLQYIATFLTRPRAGLMSDTVGPKKTVRLGLIACATAGLFIFLGAVSADHLWLCLSFFAVSRLAMGTGESFCGTGSTMWAIGDVGSESTAQVISFNGVATYGALAIGAPIGVIIEKMAGFWVVGLLIVVMGIVGYFVADRLPATIAITGERFSVGRILARVTPFGLSLALGGLGFGMIATFITLYFDHRQWEGAAVTLSIFGFVFVGARLVLSDSIERFGGFRVTQVSLLVEAIGLVILAFASTPGIAHFAAGLIGLGFALVFPALAVEMVKEFPASMRGSAIGIYNAFVDLSLFLTGPIAGLIIERYGYRHDFLLTAVAVFAAFLFVLYFGQSRQRFSPSIH